MKHNNIFHKTMLRTFVSWRLLPPGSSLSLIHGLIKLERTHTRSVYATSAFKMSLLWGVITEYYNYHGVQEIIDQLSYAIREKCE